MIDWYMYCVHSISTSSQAHFTMKVYDETSYCLIIFGRENIYIAFFFSFFLLWKKNHSNIFGSLFLSTFFNYSILFGNVSRIQTRMGNESPSIIGFDEQSRREDFKYENICGEQNRKRLPKTKTKKNSNPFNSEWKMWRRSHFSSAGKNKNQPEITER